MKNNSGRKQICFFCASPFHIMTALHLALTMEKGAVWDLYVIDCFQRAEQVTDRIDKTGIFRKAIPVHEREIEKYFPDGWNKLRTVKRLRMALSYLQLDRIAKEILKDNYKVPYELTYLTSWKSRNRMIAMYLAKSHNTKILFFEDGLASYYRKNLLNPKPLDQIGRRILFGERGLAAEPKKLLLYNPDLLRRSGVVNINNVEVEAIPKWEQTQEFTSALNKVFSYSEDDIIEEPIIIFDGLYTGEKRQIMDSFYQKVAEIAGAENVIIKKHPRDEEPETRGLKYYHRLDLPFELLCLNNNMEEKLLIGLSTTAIVTPKLLLGQEPYVLPLNKIGNMAEETLGVNFGDIKEMYKDKDKFYAAESENNALEFVKNYSDRIKRK